MSGAPHTFIDELFGSPTSSPMPADARDFPPGLEYLGTQLFSSGNDALDNMPAHSSPNTGQASDDTPTPGLGLTVEVVPAQVQGVNPEDLRLASPVVERAANPAATPLPMEILESRARMRIQLKLTPSFINLAGGAVEPQPRCVDPAVLAADPQAAVRALPPHAETAAAAGDASFPEEQEPGGDTEVEDAPDPLPTAILPVVARPLQDDEKTGVQGKRGKKRAAASGGQKRASKRRRSSSSKARAAAIEQESDADDDDEDSPVISSTGRPMRKAAQRARGPAEQDTPHSSDNETEKPYTCTKCSKTFERIYDLDRHLKNTACGSADKLVCRVCGAAMTPRSDAVRRHLMTTEKCVEQQSALSPALREALGCPTPEQRAAYMMAQAARKKAKKSK